MADGIYTALSGGISSLETLDVLANNLANTDSVGFKQDRPVFAELLEAQLPGTAPAGMAQVAVAGTSIDLRQGSLVRTGNPLDLALAGDGFFAVQTPGGVRYTRRGDFRAAPSGLLEDALGNPVLGRSGPIRLSPGTVTVDEAGNVSVDGRALDQLRVVDLPAASLSKEGASLFRSGAPEQPSRARVAQGHVERSNVSAVGAMSTMITATRAFEIAMQAIQTHRRMDERIVNDLGKGT